MSIGQYVDRHIDRWTGQYPIWAYTTWRDLNQSQPHISIGGIILVNMWCDVHAVAVSLLQCIHVWFKITSLRCCQAHCWLAEGCCRQVLSVTCLSHSVRKVFTFQLSFKPCHNGYMESFGLSDDDWLLGTTVFAADYLNSAAIGLPRILEGPWIFFSYIQGLEST